MAPKSFDKPKTRIMIVEDEFIVALDEKQLLESWGYDVVAVAHSGEEAVDQLFRFQPDLVLMDVKISGILNDGIATAKYLGQQMAKLPPIIFLTALADDVTKSRAKYVGPAAYVTKPFAEEDLRKTISDVIEQMQSTQRNKPDLNRDSPTRTIM